MRGAEVFDDEKIDMIEVDGFDEDDTCRECGCSSRVACEGGCIWVEPDLCSACALGRGGT